LHASLFYLVSWFLCLSARESVTGNATGGNLGDSVATTAQRIHNSSSVTRSATNHKGKATLPRLFGEGQ
jgi:hypothetical protein